MVNRQRPRVATQKHRNTPGRKLNNDNNANSSSKSIISRNSRTKSQLSFSKSSVRSPNSRRGKFEKSYGQRLDATLVGTSDMDKMNKDLMAVTADLASLLKKSQKVSEIEKNKLIQLTSIKSRDSSSNQHLLGSAFQSG